MTEKDPTIWSFLLRLLHFAEAMEARLLSPYSHMQWKGGVMRSILSTLELSTTNEVFSGHNGPIHSLSIETSESRYLLTAGNDCKLCLYDIHAKQVTPTRDVNKIVPEAVTERSGTSGHNFSVTHVEWYPNDLAAFISCSYDEKMLIWDTERFEIAGSFNLNSKINIATMHRKGTNAIVACGTIGAGIRLCDLNTGNFAKGCA